MVRPLTAWLLCCSAVAQTPAYRELYRPQFHFSPKVNWTNDPNGLVYLDGAYHLFFQFNPFGDRWGHMSWGHATSHDLVHWKEEKVALPEENGVMIFTGETRWVLKIGLNPGGLQGGSGEQYFVGRFDGTRFKNDNPTSLQLWTDYGKDCYCALTFNHLPPGRPATMIGWMNNWEYANTVPTKPWRGQMTVPRTLSLKMYAEGIRLAQQPVEALRQLRDKRFTYADLKAVRGQTLELTSTIELGQAVEAGFKVLSDGTSFTAIGYDVRAGRIFADRTHSGNIGFSPKFPARVSAPFQAGKTLRLRILIDRNSVEVFAGDGQVTLTNLVFPSKDGNRLEFYTTGGTPGKVTAEGWTLRSIW